MEKFIDFLFWENEILTITSKMWITFSYSKCEFKEFYKKNLTFSDLEELKRKCYACEMRKSIEIYSEIKDFCDKYNLNIDYFIDIEEITKKEEPEVFIENKHGFIYLIKVWEFYKIWKTINIKSRFKKYQTENPNKAELIHYFHTNDYTKKEKELHLKFKEKNHNREWFKLNNEDILFFKNL